MKCPHCSASNGKTNKYCRECGTRLDVLVSREPERDSVAARADEVGLGEELFTVLEMFESGDLDSALKRALELASANPGSASAHSLVALVCERKAEHELSGGDPERGHELLKLALERYEAIIDLNPDSSADREKLASLRLRYTGQSAIGPKPKSGFDFAAALQAVPRPVLAGFATFLVLLALAIVLIGPSGGRPKPAVVTRPTRQPIVSVTQAPVADTGLKVYTFPQASNPPPAPPPMASEPEAPAPTTRPDVEVKPMRLPKIDRELILVAEPKAAPKKAAPEPVKQPIKVSENKEPPAPSGPSGGTLLAQAIRLSDQGKASEAVGTANQAIALWQSDIDAGKGVDSARRGIANATKLISVWQQSAGNGSDSQ